MRQTSVAHMQDWGSIAVPAVITPTASKLLLNSLGVNDWLSAHSNMPRNFPAVKSLTAVINKADFYEVRSFA